MRDVFVSRLLDLAQADERILLVTADLGFGVLREFSERLPRQFLNVGVAEQNMTGVATGLALEGRVVFTYSLGNFPTLRCLEQIRNDACYHDANVKVITVGGGLSYGQLGMSHHATEDLAVMRALPGVTIMAPGCDGEAEQCARLALDTPGVCYLRLDKSSAGDTTEPGERLLPGRARLLRDGSDFTVITTGGVLNSALEAARELESMGLQVRLLSMPFVKPLDGTAIAEAAASTGGVLTVEEHSIIGGLGGAVAEFCLESGCLPRRFQRLGLRDEFPSIVGSQVFLRNHYGMGRDAIVDAVRRLAG